MTDMPEKPRLIPYARQSKGRPGETRETSLSLESQEDEIRAWGQANGFEVETAIRDHDLVGDDPARPGVAEMETRTAPGVTFAVYKWDRLARDLVLQETIVRAIERRGGAVISIREPSNKLTRAIYGAVNEDFKDALSDRIKAVTRAKALRGEAIFATAPFGYAQSGTAYSALPDGTMRAHPSGPLVPDPEEAAIVRDLYARYLAGESMWSLASELNARGVPRRRGARWSVTGLRVTFQNPIYAGLVHLDGVIVADGKHAALVDRAVWDAVQTKVARNAPIRRTSPNNLSSWCEGRIEHACGRRMYLFPLQGKRRKDGTCQLRGNFACAASNRPARLNCEDGRRMMLMPKVERLARACLIADLGATSRLADAIARAEMRAGGDLADRQRAAIASKRAAAERRRARARESWLAGMDDLAVWQAEHDAYLATIAELDRDLDRLPSAPEPERYRAAADSLIAFAAIIESVGDDGLGRVLDALGIVVVSEAGVRIRYHAPVNDFIPAPTVMI